MRHYIPAFACIFIAYALICGAIRLHLNWITPRGEVLEELEVSYEKLKGGLRQSLERNDDFYANLIPYREFYAAWKEVIDKTNIASVMGVIDELSMRSGVGVTRRSTSQRQSAGIVASQSLEHVISITVTGEFVRVANMIRGLNELLPLVRTDMLRMISASGDGVDLILQLGVPVL